MNQVQNIWNEVKVDLVAGVTALGQCINLSDAMNDGEYKLVCADININKLKVFKPECLVSESNIQFPPVSVKSYYAVDQTTKVNSSMLAVAAGSYIFIYKNLKGTVKLLVPNVEINSLELAIWNDLRDGKLEQQSAIDKLKALISNSKTVVIIINRKCTFNSVS